MFIDIHVDPEVARDPVAVSRLAEVCPVDIYRQAEDGTLRIAEDNLDECVLCRLCLDATPPGAVTIRRLYDGGRSL